MARRPAFGQPSDALVVAALGRTLQVACSPRPSLSPLPHAGPVAPLPELISVETVRALEVRSRRRRRRPGRERSSSAARCLMLGCLVLARVHGSDVRARAHGLAGLAGRDGRQRCATRRRRSWSPPLQAELDNGAAVAALRRFNDNLAALPADSWGARGGHSAAAWAAPCQLIWGAS